jgi:hypothetical protein
VIDERKDELLFMKQIVPNELWENHQAQIRSSMHRDIGIKLIDWLVEHGPAIVSKVEELAVVSGEGDWYGSSLDMTEVRMRMKMIPVGSLVPGEWWCAGGPMHRKFIRTDGSPYWRVPIAGEPTKIADYIDAIATPSMLVALYRRDGDIYVFEGYER